VDLELQELLTLVLVVEVVAAAVDLQAVQE
jgi:hypothetical protein